MGRKGIVFFLVFGSFSVSLLSAETDSGVRWRCLGVENRVSIVGATVSAEQSRRKTDSAQTDSAQAGCEQWECLFPANASLLLGYPLDYPHLIEDLDLAVWVKSDHPGLAVGVQIVLPHTIHPRTGKPVTFLVAGMKYAKIGEWERLAFHDKSGRINLVPLADKAAKMLRGDSELAGIQIDLREQYVRQLVLYAEGNRAQIRFLIDDVEQEGALRFWDKEKLDLFEREEEFPAVEDVSRRTPSYRFDPVNLVAFKLQAGSGTVFLPSSRMENEIGAVEWTSGIGAGFADYRSMSGEKIGAHAHFSHATGKGHGPIGLVSAARENSAPGNSASGSTANIATAGFASAKFAPTAPSTPAAGPVPGSIPANGIASRYRNPNDNEILITENMRIRMSDQSLVIDGDRAIGVRAIEYRGEPLSLLWEMKFNAVWVTGTPSLELLQEAREVGIFLICSPPSQAELAAMENPNLPGAANVIPLTNAVYDNVLAWNIGDQCLNTETAINGYYQLCKAIRAADRRRTRPLICSTDSGTREYSRFIEILLLRRDPMFTSFDLRKYTQWQNAILQYHAYPATPSWSTIQTQPDPRMAMQWELFGGDVGASPQVLFEQMQLMVHMAIASGSHGLVFTSNTPLNANDPETEYRRLALELINLELTLIEEWFSKGTAVTVLNSNNPSLSSVLLQTNRSRLLLPIWREPQSQHAIGPAFAPNISYVIPGIPDDYDAFHLIPGGVRPIDTERVAGGSKINLDEGNLNSLIFFTSDPSVRSRIEKRSREWGARAAHLACELARKQRTAFDSTFTQLRKAQAAGRIPERDKTPLIGMEEQESLLHLTQESIDLCAGLFEQRDYSSAYLQAERATRGIRAAARDLWMKGTRFDLQPEMTPVSVSFHNLPLYLETYNRSVGAQRDVNRLPSGTAEDISQWTSEWMTSKHRIEGVAAEAMLSRAAARSGLSGIEMVVRPSDPAVPVSMIETAPIWMISNPGIPVRTGEMLCISGWINIPQRITGSTDGVMIFDNIGGESLALRFEKTSGWQPFAFYRVAPGDGQLYLTLSLCGLGKVHIDDIEVTSVRFNPTRIQQVPTQPTNTPYWQRLNPLQLLPQGWMGNRESVPPASPPENPAPGVSTPQY
ncbi:MAG TPA: hypothetical protein DEB39_11970 [Planctomycetaceae bacterium]|nr:hypothetical protein [Planctomycetaceae bacterium]